MTDDTPSPQRRRPVLGISGWLLFVCLFLPTLRVCSSPTAPIQFPPTYGVYLGALAIGVAAFSVSLRTRRIVHALVIGVLVASVITFGVLFVASEVNTSGVIALAAFTGLALTIYLTMLAAKRTWTPRAIAIGWMLHALVASAWNTLLVLDKDAMWGAVLALGASGAMLVDAVIAISIEQAEVVRRREEHTLPVARMIERQP